MKAIERLIIRKRRVLTKRSERVFQQAIRQQYQSVIDAMKYYTPEQLPEAIPKLVKTEPIEQAFNYSYSSAAEIAVTWRNHLAPKKSEEDDLIYRSIFERTLTNYGKVKAGNRIVNITGTTYERITAVVKETTTQAIFEGIGIDKLKDLILENMLNDYKDFTKARAKLIAQTEMITASNQATIEGAKSTGLEYRKFWSISGIGNSRQSHVNAEQESINKNGLREDEKFTSTNMLFPGDPEGDAREVCNCHCTLLIEIV